MWLCRWVIQILNGKCDTWAIIAHTQNILFSAVSECRRVPDNKFSWERERERERVRVVTERVRWVSTLGPGACHQSGPVSCSHVFTLSPSPGSCSCLPCSFVTTLWHPVTSYHHSWSCQWLYLHTIMLPSVWEENGIYYWIGRERWELLCEATCAIYIVKHQPAPAARGLVPLPVSPVTLLWSCEVMVN